MVELISIAVRASLVGLLVPFGIGLLWETVLIRHPPRPSLGMLYWLGLLSVGAVILGAHGLGVSRPFAVALILAASAIGWIWRLLRPRRETRDAVGAAWALLPLAAGGIAYCVLDPVRVWDAYLIWFARVRLLEQWIPLPAFQELQIVHPGYPFLGAAAWWWTAWAARVPVEAGRVVFLFAYLAFFVAVLPHLRAGGAGDGRVTCLWVFAAYTCFFLPVINGYQDGFLMASAGMVALAFLHWGDRGLAWILPIAGGLSLIKAEGAILGAMLVFCWFASEPARLPSLWRDRRGRRSFLVGASAFVLVVAAWPLLLAQSGLSPAAVQGDAFRIRSVAVIVDHAQRIPTILREIVWYFVRTPWISIPMLAAVVFALSRRERIDHGRRFVLGFALLHLLFVTTVFWMTQQPFEWHLGTALERLLIQGRLVMLLFVLETARRHWIASPSRPVVLQRA